MCREAPFGANVGEQQHAVASDWTPSATACIPTTALPFAGADKSRRSHDTAELPADVLTALNKLSRSVQQALERIERTRQGSGVA